MVGLAGHKKTEGWWMSTGQPWSTTTDKCIDRFTDGMSRMHTASSTHTNENLSYCLKTHPTPHWPDFVDNSNFQTRLPDSSTDTCCISTANARLASSQCIVLPPVECICYCDFQLTELRLDICWAMMTSMRGIPSSCQVHIWYGVNEWVSRFV